MTETRTAQPQSSAAEEEIAAAIALLLAGSVAPPAGASLAATVAALLARLPGLPETDEIGAVSRSVSRLVVRDRPTLKGRVGRLGGAESRAHLDNLSYRAHYAIQAMRRVAESVKNGDAIRDALSKEARPFSQHLEANRRRLTAARMVQAATERWGPVLGWVHPGHTDTHRPSHVAASGANFRADAPPASTGGFPGTLPNCECVAGAPNSNGRMLV